MRLKLRNDKQLPGEFPKSTAGQSGGRWCAILLTGILTSLAAGCATPEPVATNFKCESGQSIAVLFVDDTAKFTARGKYYELPAETLDDYRIGMTRMLVRPSPSGMSLQFGDEVVYFGCQEQQPVEP